MIILDTNVLSEPLRPRPDAGVVAWLDAQVVETLYLATITLAEIRFGITVLPDGRKKRRLAERFEDAVVPAFDGRILAFDEPASVAYAARRAAARASGHAIGATDGFIAGIAAARDFAVATRDTQPFECAGVRVINPFEAAV